MAFLGCHPIILSYTSYVYLSIIKTPYRLPTGNTTGEFQSLYNQYPTYDQMRKYPVGMVLGGRYYWGDSTLNYQGETGRYWSSSAATSATDAYYLSLLGTHNAVYTAYDISKLYGFTLRCLGLDWNKIFVGFYGLDNYNIIMIHFEWDSSKNLLFASSQLGRPPSLRLNHITAREI